MQKKIRPQLPTNRPLSATPTLSIQLCTPRQLVTATPTPWHPPPLHHWPVYGIPLPPSLSYVSPLTANPPPPPPHTHPAAPSPRRLASVAPLAPQRSGDPKPTPSPWSHCLAPSRDGGWSKWSRQLALSLSLLIICWSWNNHLHVAGGWRAWNAWSGWWEMVREGGWMKSVRYARPVRVKLSTRTGEEWEGSSGVSRGWSEKRNCDSVDAFTGSCNNCLVVAVWDYLVPKISVIKLKLKLI